MGKLSLDMREWKKTDTIKLKLGFNQLLIARAAVSIHAEAIWQGSANRKEVEIIMQMFNGTPNREVIKANLALAGQHVRYKMLHFVT